MVIMGLAREIDMFLKWMVSSKFGKKKYSIRRVRGHLENIKSWSSPVGSSMVVNQ